MLSVASFKVKDANKIASLHRLALMLLQRQGCQSVNHSTKVQHSQQSFRHIKYLQYNTISTSTCRAKDQDFITSKVIATKVKSRYEDQPPLTLNAAPPVGKQFEDAKERVKRLLAVSFIGLFIYGVFFAKEEENHELKRVMSTPIYELDINTDGQVIRNEMATRAMKGKSNKDLEQRLRLIHDDSKRRLAEEQMQNYKILGPRKTVILTKEDIEEKEEAEAKVKAKSG